MSGSKQLSARQEKALAALLAGPTHKAAAATAGVSEATLRRWLQQPEFKAAYRQARLNVLEHAVGRLQQVAGKAVDALERNLDCGNPTVEVRAALGVIEQAHKGRHELDWEQRWQELEAESQGGHA